MRTRKLLFTGVLSLAAVKAYHAFVAFKVGTNLDVTILNPRIHKLDTTGITVRLELLLKNPTRYRMKITQPFVRVFVQGFKIASSNLANKTFTLEPLGGQQLDTIEFKIPVMTSVSILSQLRLNLDGDTGWEKLLYAVLHPGYLISQATLFFNSINMEVEYSAYANSIRYQAKEKVRA